LKAFDLYDLYETADNFREIENCVKNHFLLGTEVLSVTWWIRGLEACQPIRRGM